MDHGIISGSAPEHTSAITINTIEQVRLPFVGVIDANQVNKTLIPGDYSTFLTYTITY